VDKICDRVEAAWKEGLRPEIEDYLKETAGPLRAVLLHELVALELAYRRSRDEQPTEEEYRLRFPNDSAVIREVFAEETPRLLRGATPVTRPPRTHPDKPTPSQDDPQALHRSKRAELGTADYLGDKDTEFGRELGAGSVFGNYELLERIGKGGMGLVYRAWQRNANRIVALKVIRPDILAEMPADKQPQWLERFRNEAEMAARLEHDHIVTVYEVGESEGQFFYSMRYIGGPSLAAMVRKGTLPGPKAAAYLEPVARAVHHAHTCGILHRDLKPGNILVDGNDRPFVADFGLAKWMEGPGNLTQTGAVLGSPSYMPPEQVQDSTRVTVRSDVYSLGATLYDLLTGRPPFKGAGAHETLFQVMHVEPVRPRQLNPGLDRDLETITLKCLHKEPARRYPTAEALADDLRRYCKGEPILARPISNVERLGRWCRRNPLLAGLSATVFLLVLVTLVLVEVGRHRAAEVERRTLENRRNQRDSLLHQARAHRHTVQLGRRWSALETLKKAATIRPGPDLRDEYLFFLDQPDLRPLRDLTAPVPTQPGVSLLEPVQAGDLPEEWLTARALYWPIGRTSFGAAPHRIRVLADNSVVEWDAQTGQVTGLSPAKGKVQSPAAMSPDGRFLAARTPDRRETRLWDLNPRKPFVLTDKGGRSFAPHCLTFGDQSDVVAVAHEPDVNSPDLARHYDIEIYILKSGEPEWSGTWRVQVADLECLRFTPNGKFLAAGMSTLAGVTDYVIQLWNVADQKTVGQPLLVDPQGLGNPPRRASQRMTFSADGRFLAVVRHSLRVWDLGTDSKTLQPTPHLYCPIDPAADAVFYSPDARWLAIMDRQGRFQLWDASRPGFLAAQGRYDTPAPVELPDRPSDAPATRLVSHPGGFSDQRMRVWEVGRPLSRTFAPPNKGMLAGVPAAIFPLVFSPDERWLAYASNDVQSPHLIDLQRLDAEPRHLHGGQGRCALAFSSDGKQLWSTTGGQARLWQLPAWQAAKADPQYVLASAFNSRGERMAAYLEEEIQLRSLDLKTGRELFSLPPSPGDTEDLSPPLFSPDGKYLLVGRRGSAANSPVEITLLDAANGRVVEKYSVPSAERLFFRDQRPMALVVSSETLAVRDLRKDDIPRSEFPTPPRPMTEYYFPSRFTFSANGQLCAETGMKGEIALWNFPQKMRPLIGRESGRPGSPSGRDLKVFSRDGSKIAAFDGTFHLKVWDTAQGKKLGQLALETRPELFAFGADDQELLLVKLGRNVQSWRPGEKTVRLLCGLETDSNLEKEIREGWWQDELLVIDDALRITDDRKKIIYVSKPDAQHFHTLYVWTLPDGKLATYGTQMGGGLPRLAVNADGSQAVLLTRPATLRVWNPDTRTEYLRVDRPTWDVSDREGGYLFLHKTLRLSPDGGFCTVVEALGQTPAVHVFKVGDQSKLFSHDLPESISCTALAEGAHRLALGQNQRIVVYDPHSGEQVVTLEGHETEVTTLAFDRSATVLASASAYDEKVRLWDLRKGQTLATLNAAQESLTRVALSPTGRWLATLDVKGRVRLWDLAEARRHLREANLDW
jgi:WD40 repeat protein/predicted Ser/Thr protein kinase